MKFQSIASLIITWQGSCLSATSHIKSLFYLDLSIISSLDIPCRAAEPSYQSLTILGNILYKISVPGTK